MVDHQFRDRADPHSRILCSCKPGSTAPTEVKGKVSQPTQVVSPAAPTTAAPTTAKPASQGPKYGGWVSLVQAADITLFDYASAQTGAADGGKATLSLTNETLLGGDWSKGPAGTNDFELQAGYEGQNWWGGMLAQSWEFPTLGTMTFHLRKGVTFAVSGSDASKLVNGRQLTADDVVFSIKP